MNNGPLQSWLSELKSVNDSECTTMLQSKPIRPKRVTKDVSKEPLANIHHKIGDILEKADIISGLFTDLIRYILLSTIQVLTLTLAHLQTSWWMLPIT